MNRLPAQYVICFILFLTAFPVSGQELSPSQLHWSTHDGDKYMEVNGAELYLTPRYDGTGPQTVTATAKLNRPDTQNWQVAFELRFGALQDMASSLHLMRDANNVGWVGADGFHNSVGIFIGKDNEVSAQTPDLEWHRLKYVSDGHSLTAWLDGKQVGAGPAQTIPNSIYLDNGQDFRVPCHQGGVWVRNFSIIDGTRQIGTESVNSSGQSSSLPVVSKAKPMFKTVVKTMILSKHSVRGKVASRRASKHSKVAIVRPKPAISVSALPFVRGAAYTITDIGTLPGDAESMALDINDIGTVVGQSITTVGHGTESADRGHAFSWFQGRMNDLGVLPGYETSQAFKINNAGFIVGECDNFASDFENLKNGGAASSEPHAFFWSYGQMQDLDMLKSGTVENAVSINSHKAIVGVIGFPIRSDGTIITHPFIWQSDQMRDLGPMTGFTNNSASDINDNGWIILDCSWFNDQALPPETVNRSFLWVNGKMSELPLLPGYSNSHLHRINNAGVIVGSCTLKGQAGGARATLWHNGLPIDLGTLPSGGTSAAFGINNNSDVVGIAGQGQAVLWNRKGIFDLNTKIPSDLGWILTEADAINNHGQIVGIGLHNGHRHGFLLTPNY